MDDTCQAMIAWLEELGYQRHDKYFDLSKTKCAFVIMAPDDTIWLTNKNGVWLYVFAKGKEDTWYIGSWNPGKLKINDHQIELHNPEEFNIIRDKFNL